VATPSAIRRARLARPAVELAPRLLGASLVSDLGGARVAVRLTEVEAYEGLSDPASHAFRGPTARSSIMFGPPGYLYCYFTYGMHWCANIVCDLDGRASAVLLRAAEVVVGLETARARRPAARGVAELGAGPARLATCLGLATSANGLDLCDPASPVRLSRLTRSAMRYEAGPRVGITVATERPWRFWLPGEPSVSGGRRARGGSGQTG